MNQSVEGLEMAESEVVRKFQRELNAGVTALLALTVVQRARRPMYGYEVATHLSGLAEDALPMSPGALYPVLRSMEKLKLLTSHIEASNAGPPRKYYSLTSEGQRTLAEWTAAWRQTRTLVDRVLETNHGKRSRNASRRPAVS